MKFPRVLLLLCVLVAPLRAGDPGEELKALVGRQRELLKQAETKKSQIEMEDLRPGFQTLIFDYEKYLQNNPKLAAGYVAYGLFLMTPEVDMRKRGVGILLKANELDPNMPQVKNQLGNYLAEEGRPLEAVNYYLSAVELKPKEPLYHYQLGSLLAAAKDDFLKSGNWTRAVLDESMQEAFEQAMVLSPGDIAYAMAYCKSFYEVEHPDWDEALENWRGLETKMGTALGRQTVRVHQAEVLKRQKKVAEARALLATVTAEELKEAKEKLVAELAGAGEK